MHICPIGSEVARVPQRGDIFMAPASSRAASPPFPVVTGEDEVVLEDAPPPTAAGHSHGWKATGGPKSSSIIHMVLLTMGLLTLAPLPGLQWGLAGQEGPCSTW